MSRSCNCDKLTFMADLTEIEPRFQDHLRGTQTEIWDIPISGDVLSTPFEREARGKQHSSLKAPA